MYTIAIIPARMASSRFPGKPMHPLCGMPMIGHVYHRVKRSPSLQAVYVATCDQEIADYITSIGGIAIMTADTHERCSDRCAEAMLKAEALSGRKCDIMVMVQGDEPLTDPAMIDEAVAPLLSEPELQITNLMGRLTAQEDVDSPNEVKVVFDKRSNALYFSREAIPSPRKFKGEIPYWKQVTVIPFRREFLIKYNQMPQTPLEIIESVDMMRIVENNIPVRMIPTRFETKAVDIPEDSPVVEALLRKDALFKSYGRE